MISLSPLAMLFTLLATLCTVGLSVNCTSSLTVFVGSYTGQPWLPSANGSGVIMTTIRSGKLRDIATLSETITGPNPSYLASAQPHLYATNENEKGAVSQVKFSPFLPHISDTKRLSRGGGTTHVAVIEGNPRKMIPRNIIAANYGGSVSSFIKTSQSFQFKNKFVVPARLASQTRHPNLTLSGQQTAPHPHMVLPFGGGLVVPDLGSDIVHFLSLNRSTGMLGLISRAFMQPGDGPRHAAINPKQKGTFYVVNELSLTIAVFKKGSCTPGKGINPKKIVECERKSLLTEDPPADMGPITAAAIRVSKDGKFVYASLRYPGTVRGKIVAYNLTPSGGLGDYIGAFPSRGVHPRDFFLIDGIFVNGKCRSLFLIANRDSNNVVVVLRNRKSGRLGRILDKKTIWTPTSVIAA